MNQPFELFLALRYLRGSRRTLGGGLTSIIAVAGVAVGVAALVATLAVMTGFREDIRDKILGAQPHLLVQSMGEEGLPDRDYTDRFDGVDGWVSWAPYVMGQALLRGGGGTQGVVVKGVDAAREPSVTGLDGRLVDGDWTSLASTGPAAIFIGREVARAMRAQRGDPVVVAVSAGEEAVWGGLPRFYEFTVAGVLETGLHDYDASLAVVGLASAQRLFGLAERVTGLGVRLKNADEFQSPAAQIQARFRHEALVRSWLGMNRPLFAALRLEKIVMFLILTLITLVAAFTIFSNLLLVTAQRVREIGILRAMGAGPGAIQRIFLWKGLLLGVVGTVAGTAGGLALALLLKRYEFIKLPADIYYVERLPVRVVPGDVALVAGAAVLIVLLATVYPARAAARLDALEAVRRG